jgi:hypothetical protein
LVYQCLILFGFPFQVPSAYFVTDTFLALDRRLHGGLLKPDKTVGEDKMRLAGREALKIKRLIGALRALWRSSNASSHDNRVAALKSMIQASPVRAAPAPPESSEPAESPEPAQPSDGESQVDSQEEEKGEDTSGSDEDSSEENAGEELGEDAVDSSQATSTQEDSVDSLNAETLRLDPEPRPFSPTSAESVDSESSEKESPKDSQVSSGWMGQAIMAGNRLDPCMHA